MALSSKWVLLLLVLAAILITLAITGRKSVHIETTIQAPVDQVWRTLAHLNGYPNWNPVMIPLEGDLAVGQTVNYRFVQNEHSQSEIPAKVKQMTENQLLNQGGGLTGILTFDHFYRLQPEGSNTKLIIHEDYRGVAVHFWNPKAVEAAYQRLANALENHIGAATRSQ